MGLEMIGLLVHVPTLETLLDESWDKVHSGMENGAYRAMRPVQDDELTTTFAIDAEAELLDWMDAQDAKENDTLRQCLTILNEGCEGLLHLMRWASPGQWEVWEGRAFLHLEQSLGREVADVHELYTEDVWRASMQHLHGISPEEFAQRVVLNWMERRKALGETLEESEDPKIVPTFEAHTRAAKALVHTVNRALNEDELVLVVGREHLEASRWGHGDWNLATYLQSC